MKQHNRQWVKGWVKLFLPFYLFTFLPLTIAGQGLPHIRNYTAAEYGGHNRNFDIEIGQDGTVFVANFEGLLYYDRAQWRMLHTPDINRITVVYCDSKNTVWVGGYNFLAHLEKRANGELYMQQVENVSLFKGEVMEIFEDGTLQFVASDNKIYEIQGNKIALKKVTKADFRPSLESEIVSMEALKDNERHAVLDDITQTEKLDGGLQVKVKKNNGLIIADAEGHDLYTITEANGLCSNQVAYVAYDGHGLVWGATAHGIFSIELPSVYSYFLPKDGLTGEVHAITAFSDKIYVGGTSGVYAISSRQCKDITEINNICWTLSVCRDGLLAATSSGIYKISAAGGVSRMTSNSTTAMFVDGDKVYAGEPDGVWLYQLGSQQKTKVNDLPLVTEIRQNAQGSLWFHNIHGESIGTMPTEKVEEPIAALPPHLLMPVKDIEVKAQYRYGSQVWIGGDEVLAIIDADKKELATLPISRNVRFCSIIMGNDSVLWGGYGDMPQELPKLSSDENQLHFFYALDYAPLSGKTLYRYRLDNNKWSAWTDKQDIEFLNLPYGSFTLYVQAQLANGELSEEASVRFKIAYPLVMRWYMVVLYFLFIAYLVFKLFQYRLKRLERDKLKLEHIVEERTADLRSAQHELIRQEKMASVGKLTEGLIDRILNPMNYIINFSKMSDNLLNDLKENIDNNKDNINKEDYEDTLDVLHMLSQNLQSVNQYGQNTTRIIKGMEEMLKDRTSGFVDMDLLTVLRQNEEMVNSYYAQEIAQYHIQSNFNIPDKPMPIRGNADMLSKTIMSMLANAVYAVVKKSQRIQSDPTSGKSDYVPEIALIVDILPHPKSGAIYKLTIHDNGIGIEEKNLDKVFDPFFTTKTTSEASGVGLYISREIVQNHGGDISVTSVKHEYTDFIITLPQQKNEK